MLPLLADVLPGLLCLLLMLPLLRVLPSLCVLRLLPSRLLHLWLLCWRGCSFCFILPLRLLTDTIDNWAPLGAGLDACRGQRLVASRCPGLAARHSCRRPAGQRCCSSFQRCGQGLCSAVCCQGRLPFGSKLLCRGSHARVRTALQAAYGSSQLVVLP